MVNQIYYESPCYLNPDGTNKTTMRCVGMIIQDETTGKTKKVDCIKIDVNGLFADIIYNTGETERTYKIHNLIIIDDETN